MAGSLATTNVLLGVMIALSAVQTLLIVGAGIVAFNLYRRVAKSIDGVDLQELQHTLTKVNAVLDEVEVIASGVRAKTRWLAVAGRGLGVLLTALLRPQARVR
jgi:hypothetical protein